MPGAEDERHKSFWPQVAGDWTSFRDRIRQKWGQLTDDDLDYMAGNRDRTIGRIRERYGSSQWNENDIERELFELRNL